MSVLCSVFQTIDLPQHLAQAPLLHNHDHPQKSHCRPLTGLSTRQSTRDNPSSNHPLLAYWTLSGIDSGTNNDLNYHRALVPSGDRHLGQWASPPPPRRHIGPCPFGPKQGLETCQGCLPQPGKESDTIPCDPCGFLGGTLLVHPPQPKKKTSTILEEPASMANKDPLLTCQHNGLHRPYHKLRGLACGSPWFKA